MALPQTFTRPTAESIFDRTIKSAEDISMKPLAYHPFHEPAYDRDNFIKWGASLLGKFVLSHNLDFSREAAFKFNRVLLSESRTNWEVFMYQSLQYTLEGCLYTHKDDLYRIYRYVESRFAIQRAMAMKNGSDELFSRCEAIILRVQKADLKANNPTEWIQRVCVFLSSAASDEKHESSETTVVDFEDLVQYLRKVVDRERRINRKDPKFRFGVLGDDSSDEEEYNTTHFHDMVSSMVHMQRMVDFINGMSVHKPAIDEGSSASSNDEEENDVGKTIEELVDFTQLAIFEHFRKSAEAIYAEDTRNADNLTMWGAALLGISLQKSSEDAKAYLEAAVSKLELALLGDGNKNDTLCYAGNSYAALAWLTFDISKSVYYKERAYECIEKAMDLDPLGTSNFTQTLEDKEIKKRKHGDAFDELWMTGMNGGFIF